MHAFLNFTLFLQIAVMPIFGFAMALARRDMVHFYNKEQRRKGGVEIKLPFFDNGSDPLPDDLDMLSLEPFTQRQIGRYRFWKGLFITALVLLAVRFLAGAVFK